MLFHPRLMHPALHLCLPFCGTLPENTGVCGLTQMAVLLMLRGRSELADDAGHPQAMQNLLQEREHKV